MEYKHVRENTGRTASARPHVLSRTARPTLTSYADANVLLAFDFDGTLVPGVRSASTGELSRETKLLLRALSVRYPVAILTDRRGADIERRLQDTGVWIAVGCDSGWLAGAHAHGARLARRSRQTRAGSPSKDVALRGILRDFGCHATIYVGDDVDDEPVFKLKRKIPLLGVRVGETTRTSAAYVIDRRHEVAQLLRLLIGIRRPFALGAAGHPQARRRR